jgi:hypothetical protein
MHNIKNLRLSSIILIIVALFWTLSKNPMGPIFLALAVLIIPYNFFKSRNRAFYIIITAVILAVMILAEYFLVHIQNTVFYILLLTMNIGIFVSFYFYYLFPKDQITKRIKILSWTGSILFIISLSGLMGIIFNNFMITLILIVFTLIAVLLGRLIRRKISKDALKEDFDDVYYTKDPEEYWFRYEVGGIPRPLRWQGWVWYGIIFLSPFLVLIFDNDPNTGVFIIVASFLFGFIISILKSNYRESIAKYRENLKK